jgi:hypothetical protein
MSAQVARLRRWKGYLSIAIAAVSPFTAWGMGESTLKASIILALIGGLTATHNWLDQSLNSEKPHVE